MFVKFVSLSHIYEKVHEVLNIHFQIIQDAFHCNTDIVDCIDDSTRYKHSSKQS